MTAPSLLQLFFIFFYIGLFTIGGGLVAITLMQQLLVDRGLIPSDVFVNMIAISESTPGPIGINMATYVGNHFYGVAGGCITTLGEILPSVICIIIIAKLFSRFQEKPLVKAAFSTLRPATTGLILVALVQVFEVALLNISVRTGVSGIKEFNGGFFDLFQWKSLIFYALALGALFITKIHPALLILAGAVFGILFL
ncbi:chromate transporter [Treponema sp.]|uniref:chromate transporter n=1 Tax=Treponema sp. TaxID=166 RepID=UPI00298E3CB6|nr:chromate transporter [Treponema sp.]MCR5612168.1 chromate transporter [Treponema sp.]